MVIEHHPALKGMFVYITSSRTKLMMTKGLPGDARGGYPRQISDHDETAPGGVAEYQWAGAEHIDHARGDAGGGVPASGEPTTKGNALDSVIWDGDARVET